MTTPPTMKHAVSASVPRIVFEHARVDVIAETKARLLAELRKMDRRTTMDDITWDEQYVRRAPGVHEVVDEDSPWTEWQCFAVVERYLATGALVR